MNAGEYSWRPAKHFLFLWRLEKPLWSNFAGTAYGFLKYKNGLTRTFWTRKQAQARADELNATTNTNEEN